MSKKPRAEKRTLGLFVFTRIFLGNTGFWRVCSTNPEAKKRKPREIAVKKTKRNASIGPETEKPSLWNQSWTRFVNFARNGPRPLVPAGWLGNVISPFPGGFYHAGRDWRGSGRAGSEWRRKSHRVFFKMVRDSHPQRDFNQRQVRRAAGLFPEDDGVGVADILWRSNGSCQLVRSGGDSGFD